MDARFSPPPEAMNCLACQHHRMPPEGGVQCAHPGRPAPAPVVRWYGLSCKQFEPTNEEHPQ